MSFCKRNRDGMPKADGDLQADDDERKQKGEGNGRLLSVSAVAIAILIALYWLWPAYHDFMRDAWKVLTSGDEQKIRDWVAQFGAWGPLVIVLLMILQMFLFVAPSWLLMVIAVLAYGPLWGCVLAIVAVAAASALGYGIGHVIGRHGLYRLLGEKKEKQVLRETDRYGLWAAVIARINPFLSNDAISIIGGMLHLGFWKFMLATVAGIAPLAVLIGVFGKDWTTMKTGLLWLSIASVIGLGIKIWFDKRQDKKRAARKA